MDRQRCFVEGGEMNDTEITVDHLKTTMALAKQLGDVLNGHPLYIGMSALTTIMAHLLVTNEHVAPAERGATLADEQLREAITFFRMSEVNHAKH
jgi:hypothetical protein